MKIVGLITEYNPFHNGHLYHMRKAKEVCNADAVIAVMSGDFVQRGLPSIMPKRLRAQTALACGADLVLELPVRFATGSAQYFAEGAVSLLDALGCVDALCFGSECGDINALWTCARVLAEEPEGYRAHLKDFLRKGCSFPAARQRALELYLGEAGGSPACPDSLPDTLPDILISAGILTHPNNILGIEYLRALYKTGSRITPCTIRRRGSRYDDDTPDPDGYSSSSALRQVMAQAGRTGTNEDVHALTSALTGHVPGACLSVLEENWNKHFPIWADDFSLVLRYRLMRENAETLAQYMDVSDELANRIINHLSDYSSFGEFCALLKTKDMTYTRICRALIHILLDIRTDREEGARGNADERTERICPYARVLGFREGSRELLSHLGKCAEIPLLTKLTHTDGIGDAGLKMLKEDIFAADLYESVAAQKYGTPFVSEYRQQIIRI